MDLYNVIITAKAEAQLDRYIGYIYNTLLSPKAANDLYTDAKETQEELSQVAASLRYCANPKLRDLGYRCIFFRRHRYIMIYSIDGRNVYVEAIYHQLQDYENLFLNEVEE